MFQIFLVGILFFSTYVFMNLSIEYSKNIADMFIHAKIGVFVIEQIMSQISIRKI